MVRDKIYRFSKKLLMGRRSGRKGMTGSASSTIKVPKATFAEFGALLPNL